MNNMRSEDYYAKVREHLKNMGYEKQPDCDTVMDDFVNGMAPEQSAKEFIDDWES